MNTRPYRCTITMDGGIYHGLIEEREEYVCENAREAARKFANYIKERYRTPHTKQEMIRDSISVYVVSTNELVERDLYV